MNLLQLSYFQKLAYSQHLLNTAKELNISAPTISTSIRSLEEELGVQLFRRVGRGLELNENGKAFLPHVEAMFDALASGKAAIDALNPKSKNTISLYVSESDFFSGIMSAFVKQHPNCIFQQVVDIPDEKGSLLFERDLDLIVTPHVIKNSKLSSMVVNRDRYVLVVSLDHPLAQRNRCCLADLAEETFLCRPKHDWFEVGVSSVFNRYNFTPKRTMEFSYSLRSRMVHKGLGIAISTEQSLLTHFYQGVRALYIDEFQDDFYTVYAYWRNDRPLSHMSRAFRDFMQANLEGRKDEITKRLIAKGIL